VTPIWSPEAIDDLASLRAYIAEDSPAAAQRVVLHILHNVEVLRSEHPVPDTPFIVPYRVQNSVIQVLRVFHTARRWPETF
jgi:toxin ParE1/3/4